MSRKITERRLVDVLVGHTRHRHLVRREVPHYQTRIDVLLLCSDSEELWAIEAKTEDWARALSQAIVNLAAAEKSFIAIYSEYAHRVSLDDLDRHGIGLISVGTKWGDVEVLKDAKPSPFMNNIMANRLRSLMHTGAKQ